MSSRKRRESALCRVHRSARRRLEAARAALDADPGLALSAAYYAMLYAARGALSERGSYAKTHRGTWQMFREEFVEPGLLDAELVTQAQRAQDEREQADYEAWLAPVSEARDVIHLASRFLAAVDSLLAEDDE